MAKRKVKKRVADASDVKKAGSTAHKLKAKKQKKASGKKPGTARGKPKNKLVKKFTHRVSFGKFVSFVIFGVLIAGVMISSAEYIIQADITEQKTHELVGCTGNLNTSLLQLNMTNTTLAECSLNLTGCRGDLGGCYSSLSYYKNNYTACAGQLSACTSQGSSLNSQLSSCNSDKSGCQSSLSACNTDKSSCQTSMQAWQTNFTATLGKYVQYKCCVAAVYAYYYMNNSDVACTNNTNLSTTATGC